VHAEGKLYIAGINDNPYRILGISSLATRDDAWDALQAVRKASRLKIALLMRSFDVPHILGVVKRSVDVCNLAFGILENDPVRRVLSRLLWVDDEDQKTSGNKYIAKHDAVSLAKRSLVFQHTGVSLSMRCHLLSF